MSQPGIHSSPKIELASLLRRLTAALIDFAVLALAILVIVFSLRISAETVTRSEWATVAGAFLLFLAANAVFLVRGQTIGKRLLGMRIVNLDGSPAPLWRVIVMRYGLLWFLSPIPVVGQVAALIDTTAIFVTSKRQCVHDILASTIVIRI